MADSEEESDFASAESEQVCITLFVNYAQTKPRGLRRVCVCVSYVARAVHT